MKKVIHVCFSKEAELNLKHGIKNKDIKGDNVISLYDNISQGPIADKIDASKRKYWWQSMNTQYGYNYYDIEELVNNYIKFYKRIKQIDENDTVYLWYGISSRELCGMMYVLQLIEKNYPTVYLINVSDIIVEGERKNVKEKNRVIRKKVKHISCDNLPKYVQFGTLLDLVGCIGILKQWELLKKENSILRIFRDGKVKSVVEK